MKRPGIIPVLLLFVAIAGLYGSHYFQFFTSPNSYFFNGDGDAIKNYYTPWYHVQHDSSYVWFDGMNYPYGDHIVFADAQPSLSNPVKWVSRNLTDLSGNVPGILNLAMLLSVFWAGWLMFLILRRWKIPDLWAAAFAALIAVLSPQILRMNGHYALAYSFVVPLIVYEWMCWREERSWKWTVLLALTGFALAGLHPYYLMVYAMLLSASALFELALPGRQIRWQKTLAQIAIQVLLPLFAFQLWLMLTDNVADRPRNPYGFMAYTSSWKSVFFSYLFPFVQEARHAIGLGPVHPEGFAYVGLPGTIVFAFSVFFMLKMAVKRQWKRLKMPLENREQVILIFTGFLIFLFASGYLFPGDLGKLVGKIPFLAQFRSTGRFAWVFFYIWTAFSLWLIWQWSGRGNVKIRRILLGLAMLVLAVEGVYYNYLIRHQQLKPALIEEKMAEAARILPDKFDAAPYDALLFTPFYHIGSENFSSRRKTPVTSDMMLSLQTGKPMLNTMMSRSSFSQSWKLVQFPLFHTETPELLADLPPDFSILAIEGEEARTQGMQTPWLGAPLFRGTDWYGYKITPGLIPGPEEQQAALRAHCAADTTDSAGFRLRLQGNFPITFPEKGNKIPLHTLTHLPKDTLKLTISVWARIRRDQVPVSRIWIEQPVTDGRAEYKKRYFIQAWIRALQGEWALIELDFHPPYVDLPVQITWDAYGDWRDYLQFSDLEIREKGACSLNEVARRN